MNNLKILHITYWYPNKENNIEGIFIKEHIDALKKKCENTVVHFQFKNENGCIFRVNRSELSDGTEQILVYSFIKFWFIIELISTLFIIFIILKYKLNKKYNLLNVHIAYPLLTYLHLFSFLIRIPIIVTEHWSAYHLNFGLPNHSKKLNRIKRIFYNKFTLITVSEALAKDIILFSGNKDLSYRVVPNVVNVNRFNKTYNQKVVNSKISLFSLAFWREIKNPFLLLECFKIISQDDSNCLLKIGGSGPMLSEMKERTKALDLENRIIFLGHLTKEQAFVEMKNSSVFVHTSSFETFSVVCVEALCCGTPVIANNLPAISEYIDKNNGILVQDNTIEAWVDSVRQIMTKVKSNYYDNSQISDNAISKFSNIAVSNKYMEIIRESVLMN